MDYRKHSTSFLTILVIAFITHIIVTAIWGFIFTDALVFDWKSAIPPAFILAIVLSIIDIRK